MVSVIALHRAGFICLILVLAFTTGLTAATLDQSCEFDDRSIVSSVGSVVSRRQTITVGTDGLLKGFDVLYLSRWDDVGGQPLIVELYNPNDFDGSEPDRVAQFIVDPSEIAASGLDGPWTDLSFQLDDPSWMVSAGESLYLTLSSASPSGGGGPGGGGSGYLWACHSGYGFDLYTGGRAEESVDGVNWSRVGFDPWLSDYGFRTYVPEPATMSLLVLGGLGALLRHRRMA